MNLHDIVLEIVRQEVRRRIDEYLPKPDRTITTDLSAVTIKPLRSSPMPQQEYPVTLAGDEPHGYEASPVVSLNRNGVQTTDVPELSSTDENVATIDFIAPGRYWLRPNDNAPAGATCVLSGDFDPDQVADNFSFPVTLGKDSITTDVNGVTIAPLAGPPTP